MLMNRPIKRGCMEVYNDYNSNLTNLFFCVKERPLALITELGFLPLNSRDDFEVISRQLKCEEFDDEYLAIELELADKYFSPLHAKAIKALLLKRAQRGNVRRAANYYKLIRYSLQAEFTSGMTGYGTSIGEVAANIIQEYEEIETVADLVLKPISGFEAVTSPIMVIVCIIMMAYAVIKVFFANLKRGGILLIQIAVGSLYMFSIPRGGIDAFVQWMNVIMGKRSRSLLLR